MLNEFKKTLLISLNWSILFKLIVPPHDTSDNVIILSADILLLILIKLLIFVVKVSVLFISFTAVLTTFDSIPNVLAKFVSKSILTFALPLLPIILLIKPPPEIASPAADIASLNLSNSSTPAFINFSSVFAFLSTIALIIATGGRAL